MGFWYIPYHTKSQAIPKLILVYQNIFGMANISTVETIFARLIPSEDVYPYVQHAYLIQLVDSKPYFLTYHIIILYLRANEAMCMTFDKNFGMLIPK